MAQNIPWPFSWPVIFLQSRQSLTQLSGSFDIASVTARQQRRGGHALLPTGGLLYQQAGPVTDPTSGMTFGCLRFTDTRANTIFITPSRETGRGCFV